jgi:hypothetical protein
MSHVVKLCAILALRAQTVDIAGLTLRQDVFAKSASMNPSKGFLFGQQPVEKRPRHGATERTQGGKGLLQNRGFERAKAFLRTKESKGYEKLSKGAMV